MVDFTKKIINTDKFRQAAIYYEKHKTYCPYPLGTTEYVKYWDRETERSINGYTADDGDYISGYNYFYLNYCPILRLTELKYTDRFGNEKTKRVRDRDFADFYDYDYFYFEGIQEAEDTGQHMIVLKARGKGYSYKGASMLCRNYFLIPESKSYAVASENEYLTKDGLLTKAWEFMDFIDNNTAWAKKRIIDRTMQKRSGVIVTDELGNKTEQGYRSEIIGISLKNNPDRIRGKRGKLILWEEAGMFKDILSAWQIARPGIEEDGTAFGLMVAYGTGGSDGDDFRGLRELFYRPDGYNVLSFPNIWDENVAETKCGFFVPAWSNMTTQNKETGKRIYMDNYGNSDSFKALDFIMSERKKVIEGAADNNAIDRYIAEHPIHPQEACLEISGNIFPKKELMQQLSLIRTNKKLQSHKQVGDLDWVNGELVWTQKKAGDITQYPLPRDADPKGSIVIWEHPCKDPPVGLYIAGCLTPGEQVLTDKGTMNVEDVTLEDKLISKDGDEVNIRNLQRYYKTDEDIYTIKPYGSYRTTTFTGEHPIYTNRGFVKCKDLQNDDVLLLPKLNKVDDTNVLCELRKYKLEKLLNYKEFWWLIGLWLGDGFTNINHNSYDIYVSFGKKYTDNSNYTIQLIKNVLGNSAFYTKGGAIRFTNKCFVNFINNNFGKYASGKKLPKFINNLSISNKLALLQGYLDSDGSVYKDRNKQCITFTSINLKLLEQIQTLLYSCDIGSGIQIHSKECDCTFNNKSYKSKQSYTLRIYSSFINMFKRLSDDKIGWKTKNILENKSVNNSSITIEPNRVLLKIKSINHDKYTGFVYNFECDTHTYMCQNIVTHNCDPLMWRHYILL